GVPGGVPVVVGQRHAPGRRRAGGGGIGEVPGDPGVDGGSGELAGPAGQAEQGGQRDGQGAAGGEPGGDRAVLAGGGAGAGVGAGEQVQECPGAELVHVA